MSNIRTFLKKIIKKDKAKKDVQNQNQENTKKRHIPQYNLHDLYPYSRDIYVYAKNEDFSSLVNNYRTIEANNFKFNQDSENGFWKLVDDDNKEVIVYGSSIQFHKIEEIDNEWFGVLGTGYIKLDNNGIPISNYLSFDKINENIPVCYVGKSEYFENNVIFCDINDETKILFNMDEMSKFSVNYTGEETFEVVGDPEKNKYHSIIKKEGKIIGHLGGRTTTLNEFGLRIKNPKLKL